MILKTSAIAAALALAFGGAALAQSGGQTTGPAQPQAPTAQTMTPAQRGAAQACMADIRSLCAGVQPGGGRIVQCMRDNAAKLSPGCRDALIQARQANTAGGGAR